VLLDGGLVEWIGDLTSLEQGVDVETGDAHAADEESRGRLEERRKKGKGRRRKKREETNLREAEEMEEL
jgi:hypothetical protein